MFNSSSAKAFGRGLSYHAGAGIGEAVRSATALGTTALLVLGVQSLSTRLEQNRLRRELDTLLKNGNK